MNPDLAIDLFKSTVTFALYVVAPFLGVTLVVGLLASLLQSVTSMQEQTLTFVPKLLALAGLVAAADALAAAFALRVHHHPHPHGHAGAVSG
jgi:flagellar biosynthesis protein FliQ